jgi:predicted Zn-dependent protease
MSSEFCGVKSSTPLNRRKRLCIGLAATFAASAACAAPLSAQNDQYSPRFGMGHKPDVTVVPGTTAGPNVPDDDERCFPWKLSEMKAASTSVTQLKVPPQVRREYEKACDASGQNHFDEAEQHTRKVLEKFPAYPAAWVMLGTVLESQNKAAEARDACSHATAVDAKYLPAYLCAAEISARNQDWKKVLHSADAALALNPERNPYPDYYRARACLHLNDLAEAKKSALRALDIDTNHYEPSLYFLTAQIYEREGDRTNAITQLQLLLKLHPDATQEDMAKQLLARLESQPAAK